MADITVEYVDHYLDDLAVANAARVSFDKRSDWAVPAGMDHQGMFTTAQLSDRDARLIQFLARGCEKGDWDAHIEEMINISDPDRNPYAKEDIDGLLRFLRTMPTHWAPFAHPHITLRETVPIFVARQRFKHKIGFVESEVSRRYVDSEPEFYEPAVWRKRGENKKQGSSSEGVDPKVTWFDPQGGYSESLSYVYKEAMQDLLQLYQHMLEGGVCPEQARMVLPQSMMTTYQVTGSLYAFSQLYNARTYPGAQAEIKDLAQKIGAIIEPLYPVSWRALTQ